jgi:NO-binding membrane sensor protein with MHYT domain
MDSPVLATYLPSTVALSFLISLVGSFVALTAAARIRLPSGKLSVGNTLAAGVALGGIGVWSMHFVGMLALKLDVATSYSMVETLISLVAAIVATAIALGYVAKRPGLPRILGAGTVLGLGVVFMHYLGMYGLKFGGYIRWNENLVGLSVLIAVVTATAALWLAFNTARLPLRALAAVVMATAVCTMHYTGMAAADFVCTTANRFVVPQGFGYISSLNLRVLVTVTALAMALLISIDQVFQRLDRPAAPIRKRTA